MWSPAAFTAENGAVEPAASVIRGVSSTVAVSLSTGVTPRTGTDTFRASPGSSGGESAILAPATFQRPKGPETDTFWRAERMALPVLRMV